MESNDIIKALEDWIKNYDGSYVNFKILGNALDLIIRQQTETENLKVENQSLRTAANSLKMHYEEAQAEIERLKKTEIEIDDFCRRLCRMRMLNGNAIASYEDLQNYIQQEKSEAVKECLAKVKNYIKTHCNPYGKPDFDYDTSIKILNFIDKLAKEMVGDDNE